MSETEREQGRGSPAGAVRRSQPLNLVVVGLPGAGKGTQAVQFARRHRIPKISTGDMLRDAVARGTALGREVEAILAQGHLVADDTIVQVVQERLQDPDTTRGFILDGFPRTVPQAIALDTLLTGRGPLIIVYLDISPDVILTRILSRRTCESCGQSDTGAHTSDYCASCGGSFVKRADDEEPIVRARLATYVENTQPLVDWYGKSPLFRRIDANQSLADVGRALDEAVEDCLRKRP